jgi:hypothetical protein
VQPPSAQLPGDRATPRARVREFANPGRIAFSGSSALGNSRGIPRRTLLGASIIVLADGPSSGCVRHCVGVAAPLRAKVTDTAKTAPGGSHFHPLGETSRQGRDLLRERSCVCVCVCVCVGGDGDGGCEGGLPDRSIVKLVVVARIDGPSHRGTSHFASQQFNVRIFLGWRSLGSSYPELSRRTRVIAI